MKSFGNVSRRAGAARVRALVLCAVLVALAVPAAAYGAGQKWARSWTPRAGNYAVFQARMAPAPGKGVYVGTSPCSAAHVASGIAVARYSPSGARLWGKMLTKQSHSALSGVAAAPFGDLVVAGYGPTGKGGTEWRLYRLRPGGAEVWRAGLRGLATGSSCPTDVLVDPTGSIYVCGWMVTGTTGQDAFLVKYRASGKFRWARPIDGSAHGDDRAMSLARDPSGRIYITGTITQSGTGEDVFAACYDRTGTRHWLQPWDNPVTSGPDWAYSIAASGYGVAVAGSTDGAWDAVYGAYDRDGLVLAYATNGALQWSYQVPGASTSGDLQSAYIDGLGNVAAAGMISAGSPGLAVNKAVLVMLSPAGSPWYTSWLPAGSGRGGFEAVTSRRGTMVACGFEEAGSGSAMCLHTVTPSLTTKVFTYHSSAAAMDDGTDVLCRGSATYVAGALGKKMGLLRF